MSAVNGMLRFITNGDIQQELDSTPVGLVLWLMGTKLQINILFQYILVVVGNVFAD